MFLDFDDLAPKERYKLLTAIVIPRPVAWVTTTDAEGLVNAAPYSFFNVFGEAPALVVLGLQHKPDGTPKDTTRNIRRSGEFVVNILTPALSEEMVATAAAYAPDRSEPGELGLALEPSAKVGPPALAAAPAALECRRLVGLEFSADRELLVGEAIGLRAREGLVDPQTKRVDWGDAYPIARLFGERYGRIEEIAPHAVPPAPNPR